MAKRKNKANKGGAFGAAGPNGAGSRAAAPGSAGGNAAAPNGGSDGAVAGAASRVRSGGFCVRSSLGVPFLVVSREQLAEELPSPGPEDWRELLALVGDIVKQWESRGAVVLADFEGALTGFEGEPITACFQRTLSLDPKSLRPLSGGGATKEMGLLVDLRSEESAACAKRIMESDSIAKVIWGADNDVVSLRYTPVAKPLGISAARVVDAQLGFSVPQKRLSMSAMLKRLPPKSLAGLPDKADAINFTGAHAFNRRALHLPMEPKEVAYALDDLHRIDAILRNQTPKVGSYLQAQSQSSSIVSLLLQSPASGSAAKLQHYEELLTRKSGVERQEIAVRAKRHIMAVRKALPQHSMADFASLEQEADQILKEAGVSIPDDLSFLPAGPSPEKAAAAEAAGPSGEAENPVAEAAKQVEEEEEGEAQAQPVEAARQEDVKVTEAEGPAAGEAAKEGSAAAPRASAKRKAKKRKASTATPTPKAAAVEPEGAEAAEPQAARVKKGKKRRVKEAAAPEP